MLLNRVPTCFIFVVIFGLSVFLSLFGCDSDKANNGSRCDVIDSPTGLYCTYLNPFTKTSECKAYIGTGWDPTSIEVDCVTPMGAGVPMDPGALVEIPCDTVNSVGSCTDDSQPDREIMQWFFIYDDTGTIVYDDVGVFQRGCENQMGGTFCNNVEDREEEETTTSSALLPEAVEASKSNDLVTVTPDAISDEQRAQMRENGGHIFFAPVSPVSPAVGIVIYPGGRIDSRSYAPAAQMLAKDGYYVAVVPMPQYMALGEDAKNRADDVRDSHPDITNWLITGHSMGGTAAGQYIYDKLDANDANGLLGLVIMGSYMDGDHDLSGETIPVLMLYGTEERIANADKDKYDEARAYLPAGAIHFPVEDGFHFGFCFSENNREDEEQLITHQAQHDIFVPRIDSFMKSII